MVSAEILAVARQARQAAQRLVTLDTAAKNQALAAMVQALTAHQGRFSRPTRRIWNAPSRRDCRQPCCNG